MFELELPWPPTINHYYRYGKGGHKGKRYLTDRAKAFRSEVQVEFMKRYYQPGKGISPALTGDVSIYVEMRPPDRRVRDIDNGLKALFDSLVHAGALLDDHQIKEVHLYWMDVVKGGSVDVVLEGVDNNGH